MVDLSGIDEGSWAINDDVVTGQRLAILGTDG